MAGVTRFYAYTRRLDPATGDVAFGDGTGTWDAGHPGAERVARCLRTPRGAAARDPAYGIDTAALDNARDNAPALAEQAIRDALRRYVDRGLLRLLGVDVELAGTALLYEVRFVDPRDGPPRSVTGSL